MKGLIDTTAFEPASEEQLQTLNRLAHLLNVKPLENLTKCEAAQAIAIWTARIGEILERRARKMKNKCKVLKECCKLQVKLNGRFTCHGVCTHNEWKA